MQEPELPPPPRKLCRITVKKDSYFHAFTEISCLFVIFVSYILCYTIIDHLQREDVLRVFQEPDKIGWSVSSRELIIYCISLGYFICSVLLSFLVIMIMRCVVVPKESFYRDGMNIVNYFETIVCVIGVRAVPFDSLVTFYWLLVVFYFIFKPVNRLYYIIQKEVQSPLEIQPHTFGPPRNKYHLLFDYLCVFSWLLLLVIILGCSAYGITLGSVPPLTWLHRCVARGQCESPWVFLQIFSQLCVQIDQIIIKLLVPEIYASIVYEAMAHFDESYHLHRLLAAFYLILVTQYAYHFAYFTQIVYQIVIQRIGWTKHVSRQKKE